MDLFFSCHAWQMQDCTIKVLLPGKKKKQQKAEIWDSQIQVAMAPWPVSATSSNLWGGVPTWQVGFVTLPPSYHPHQRPIRWVRQVANLDLHSGENVSVPGRSLKKMECYWLKDVKSWQWHCYYSLDIGSRLASSSSTFQKRLGERLQWWASLGCRSPRKDLSKVLALGDDPHQQASSFIIPKYYCSIFFVYQ